MGTSGAWAKISLQTFDILEVCRARKNNLKFFQVLKKVQQEQSSKSFSKKMFGSVSEMGRRHESSKHKYSICVE